MPSNGTAAEIPCCLCGTMILPNSANQCSTCLAQQVNLKGRLQRGPGGGDIVIHQCRECRRYARTPKLYEEHVLESPELLSLVLKHIPALQTNDLHLMDAMWIWTEPHSMRLIVRLTVRTEVQNVDVVQRVAVKCIVKFQQCPDCNREYTHRTWHAVVQLRQKRMDDAPKKGLAHMEMALAKNAEIRKHVLKIDNSRYGMDFYFMSLAQAQQFSQFLTKLAPMRVRTAQKLVSTDVKNNTAHVKHTISCDMVPLSRDDLIWVDKKAGNLLGGRLALVTKISSTVHLVDAAPNRTHLNTTEVSSDAYFRSEKQFSLMHASNRLQRFVVLDVELCDDSEPAQYEGPSSGVSKYALADVEVVRESDFGCNDDSFRCVTHLGHLIQPGDIVLGYDLVTTVISGGAEWNLDNASSTSYNLPDIVLVKKVNEGNNDGDDREENTSTAEVQPKSRASKRKERKLKKKDKKMRELEEAAQRMGFLDDDAPEEAEVS